MAKSRSIGGTLVTLALLGAAGYLVWKYALNEPENLTEAKEGLGDLADAAGDKWDELDIDFGDFTKVLDDLTNGDFGQLFDQNPMPGGNVTTTWEASFVKPDDGGLHLTLQNALDDTWQDEFEAAVSDWQESPALVLTPERVAVDHTCERVDGLMVVCNANFGATGWVGINENSIRGNKIVSSVSKMNEYYLRNADFEQRRYTMCHELGHGLGLPHTDENPYNSNLGNCLDYTDDPETNMLPGDVNMAKLRNMYLTTSRRVEQEDGTIVETTHLIRR